MIKITNKEPRFPWIARAFINPFSVVFMILGIALILADVMAASPEDANFTVVITIAAVAVTVARCVWCYRKISPKKGVCNE